MFKDQTDQIFEDIVETIHEPLLVLDSDLLVLSANRNFYDTFQVTPAETVGRLIYDLGNKQWDIPRLRTLLEKIIPQESKFDNYEVEHTFPDIGHKIMLLNACRITHKGIGAQLILLALEDITRRSQLESLLEDSEQRYRRLFETANDGILLLEKSAGNIAQANPAIMKMFGYSPEDYIGKKLQDVGFPPDKSDIQEILHTLERDGIINYNDAPIKTKAGKIIETDVYLVDRASLIQCNIRDITERKRAENKIHQISAIQNLILENSTLGIALVRNRVFEWVNCRLGELLLLPVEQLQGFSTRVIYPSEAAYKDLEKIAYPVIARGERSDNVLELQRSDGTLFWCRFVGKALNPAKPADGSIWMFEDITVSRQSAAALEESEKKYRELYDFLPIPVYEMDFEANITSANRAVYESFRGTKEDFRKGSKAWQLLSPQDIDKSKKNIERLLGGEKSTDTEYTLRRLDGSVFTAIVISSLIYSKDKPVGLRGAIVDITERKEAEASLKVSEERYRALFDRSLNPVFIHDFGGNFIDANQTALQLLGYDREDITSLNFASLLDSKQLPEAVRTLDELKQTGSQKEFSEFNLKCKDGTYINMETRSSVIYRDNKQYAVLGIGRDITQRKRAEAALRLSEEKYRQVVENALETIFITQKDRIKFANPRAYEQLGCLPEALMEKSFAEFIYPDDRQSAMERYGERMNGKAVPNVNSFRVVTAQGAVRWVENHALMITWEGKPANLNFATDITERKQAEDDLQKSFARTRKALAATVQAISYMVETRDPYTAGHQRRVADLARNIAQEMGLPNEQTDGIRMAGIIHDIGKISIPAEILSMPRKLSDIEFSFIKTHPRAGYDILKDIEFPWPVARIVLEHHERMNGSGYPQGLTGDNLLLESRILTVADVVEAMASHRPYRPSRGVDEAMREITGNKGVLYDPEVVDACLQLFYEKGYKFR